MHIGIDWGMDKFSVGNGQFRYTADLLTALARRQDGDRITVFGTGPTPPPSLARLFAPSAGWTWVHKPSATGRGSDWRNQWRSFVGHRRHPPDVLHVIDAPIPVAAPCPVVCTVYDLMYELFPADYALALSSRTYRRYRWLMRHRVSRCLAISRTTADDLRRRWQVPRSRIDVVYLGTDSHGLFHRTAAAPVRQEFPRRPALLSPYNLEPRKNLGGLLLAMPAVIARYPTTSLTLFGRAAWSVEREAETDALIHRLGIETHVKRLGLIDDVALADLYRAADVFVFPSLYEGFGLPLLEAMTCGGCVLGRRASAMAEVVGDAGTLIETADPTLLADGILGLLADEQKRDRLRARARERAATFTTDRMAAETVSVYRRACGHCR